MQNSSCIVFNPSRHTLLNIWRGVKRKEGVLIPDDDDLAQELYLDEMQRTDGLTNDQIAEVRAFLDNRDPAAESVW